MAGYSEALVRFVAAGCTLLSMAALYLVARRLSPRRLSARRLGGQNYPFWCVAFYAFTPMMAYFGRMPDYEALSLLICLLFAAVLVNWLRRPTRRDWWALVILTVLAVWTAWGTIIMVGALLVMALIYSKRLPGVMMLGIVAGGALIALMGYYLYLVDDTINDLINVFVWRTSMNTLRQGSVNFGWGDYFFKVGARAVILYTPTVSFLALLGGVMTLRRPGLLRAVPLALTGGALAYLLLFRNASYIHDYYWIYLAPAVALFAGCALTLLPARAPRYLRRYVRAITVSLALVSLLPLMIYLNLLYSGSDDQTITIIGRALRERTQPQDLIMSNLPDEGMSIEFYAERKIHWNVPPAEAGQSANGFGGAAYYLHCQADPALLPDVPVLEEVEVTSECRLTRLR
jgi:4-amino-4-deoxy-L-arabinose transferase-like glycosyltransferase